MNANGTASILGGRYTIKPDDLELLKKLATEDCRSISGEIMWLVREEMARRSVPK